MPTQTTTYDRPGVTTLLALARSMRIVFDDSFGIDDLFVYEGNDGRIARAYRGEDAGAEASADKVYPGTEIRYPSEAVKRSTLNDGHDYASGRVYSGTDYRAFFADNIRALARDERYRPIDLKAQGGPGETYVKVRNEYNVLLWSRSMGLPGEEGVLLNVTPFVSSVEVTDSMKGGSFSINLSSPPYTYSTSHGLHLDPEKFVSYRDGDGVSFVARESIRNPQHAFAGDFPTPFFHLCVSENDVVFVQFEPLLNEYDGRSLRRALDRSEGRDVREALTVDPSELPGATWDMIGLVDAVSGMISPGSAQAVTNVSGRDLSKLIADDANHFFASDTGLSGTGGVSPSRNRLNSGGIDSLRSVTGEATFLEAYVNRSVGFSIGFVFDQLTNIRVFERAGPFSAYPEDDGQGVVRRVTVEVDPDSDVPYEQQVEATRKVERAPGIWGAVRLVVDPELDGRDVIDSSIATSQGSIQSYLDKICQMPFAQFYGQTWGDKFYFVARKPPWTEAAIRSCVRDGLVVDVYDYEVDEQEFQFAEDQVSTWFYLQHKFGIMAASASDSAALLPSGFLLRQAARYGVKVNSMVSNYVNYDFGAGTLTTFRRQAAEDLEYVVESSAYLPYSRRGNLILTGNRRIKAGQWIRLTWTGELAYVREVTHVANDAGGETNRATNVSFERALVERHLGKYFGLMRLLPLADERDAMDPAETFAFEEDGAESIEKMRFLEKRLQFFDDGRA